MKYNVLISCPHLQNTISHYYDIFEKNDILLTIPHVEQQLLEKDLVKIIEPIDGAIIGDDEFSSNVLKSAKNLKVISKWGVGIDNIDLDCASRLGIVVKNTPGVFSGEVADVVLGYCILLSRKLHLIDKNVRSGYWPHLTGFSLQGKTIGIIGMGNIGKEVTKRANIIGMKIIGFDVISPPSDFLSQYSVEMKDIFYLFENSDIITLNCNLTKDNYHLLNSEAFSKMKKGVFIVNCARGGLIDEKSLISALNEGIVAGAALDVFENEPLTEDNPLRKYESCIFGSHNSSNTYEAIMKTNDIAINHVIEVLYGSN